MDKQSKLKKINMVIVPKVGRSFFNVVISYHFLYIAAFLGVLILVTNLLLLSGYVGMKSKVSEIKHLEEVNRQVEELATDAQKIKQDLEEIKEASRRIQDKTGISSEPGYVDYTRDDGRSYGLPSRSDMTDISDLSDELVTLAMEIRARKKTITAVEDRVNVMADKFAHVPSICPVRECSITSGFGYRNHPITGSWEFHEGLDIRGSYTTPIYATADGVVDFSGWRHGYGKTIGIVHENGFFTLYAHNSRNLVKKGERVEKGQIIGYVGRTGTSTGTHVHYEVHHNNRLENPRKFLELTIKDIEKF
ncbi:MAG TPA: M23 family metallopeptidase [bacterium]|nr:M23 family metallopeptidase [bacterium]